MKLHNFNAVYSQANILYGTTLDTNNFEDIALSGWELMNVKNIRIYRYITSTTNKRVKLPCNVETIEAIFSDKVDARNTRPHLNYIDITSHWIEQYIEAWRKNKNVFYESGSLVTYHQEGDELVFDQDYNTLIILYRGVIVDDDGLPYLRDKEVSALAAYCAYIDIYRKSLIQKDGNLLQLAMAMKADWIRLCNAAKAPDHISQNEMDDILDAKTRWDRKSYNKSFKPII